MPHNMACEAIASTRCLELQYDGFTRVVEVHCVGTTTAGNSAMRVYQIRGGSVSGEPVGWKMLTFDKTFSTRILEEESAAPRAGYKQGDRGMQVIVAEV